MAGTLSYKCPSCGGNLKFDPNSGKYTCEYCRSVFTQAQMDEVEAKEKEKNAGTPEAQPAADGGAVVYNCPSCGAEIVTDADTAATFCYYCHNPIVLEGRLSGENMPDYVIPFRIDRKKAEAIFTDWVSKKKFVPPSFYGRDQISKLSGVYFPYYLYSCKIDGHIDVNATKSAVTRNGNVEYTRTGTYHVRREGNMEVKHVIRNALSKANRVLAEGVQPYDYNEMQPFRMSYLSGFLAEKKDVEQESLTGGVEQEVHDYALNSLMASVAGYQNVSLSDDAIRLDSPEWNYALMPVWTVTYRDAGSSKLYYFSVNGQSGKVIGELPIDRRKLLLTFLGIFIPLAAVLMIVGYFLL